MSKKLKKILSLVAACAIIATMGLGAYSYFTDYATDTVTAKAGNLEVEMSDATIALADGLTILNPGDLSTLSFTVKNTGEKSADVFARLTVTGELADGSAPETDSPYKLVGDDGKTELTANTDSTATVRIYDLDKKALVGTKEYDPDKDGDVAEVTYNCDLLMDIAARNEWQDSNVTVKIEVFSKQHRNTDAVTDMSAWVSAVVNDPDNGLN